MNCRDLYLIGPYIAMSTCATNNSVHIGLMVWDPQDAALVSMHKSVYLEKNPKPGRVP